MRTSKVTVEKPTGAIWNVVDIHSDIETLVIIKRKQLSLVVTAEGCERTKLQ